MHVRSLLTLNFDIDALLAPITRRNRLDRLPKPISHFLGHRDAQTDQAPHRPLGNVVVALYALIAGFIGICVLSGLFMSGWIQDAAGEGGIVIVGSFGAAVVLELNAIESPFSQPRNALLGQLFSSLLGVSITKLFRHLPSTTGPTSFHTLRWLAGALAVATSSATMALTKTIHPPAGATALLAATEPAIVAMGWTYVGVVVLGTVVLLATAVVVNNVGRRFPVYWWSAGVPAGKAVVVEKVKEDGDSGEGEDEEKVVGMGAGAAGAERLNEEGIQRRESKEEGVVIKAGSVVVPRELYLSEEEMDVLRIIEERLRETRRTSAGEGENVLDRSRTSDTLGSASTLASHHSMDGESFEEKKLRET